MRTEPQIAEIVGFQTLALAWRALAARAVAPLLAARCLGLVAARAQLLRWSEAPLARYQRHGRCGDVLLELCLIGKARKPKAQPGKSERMCELMRVLWRGLCRRPSSRSPSRCVPHHPATLVRAEVAGEMFDPWLNRPKTVVPMVRRAAQWSAKLHSTEPPGMPDVARAEERAKLEANMTRMNPRTRAIDHGLPRIVALRDEYRSVETAAEKDSRTA